MVFSHLIFSALLFLPSSDYSNVSALVAAVSFFQPSGPYELLLEKGMKIMNIHSSVITDSVIACACLILLLSFSGCSTPNVQVYVHDTSAAYSAVLMCEVYQDSYKIPYKFFRIGHIKGEERTRASVVTQDIAKSLLRNMAKAASKEGADGIIEIVVADHPELAFVTDVGGIAAVAHTLSARGALIRFERDEAGDPVHR
jgi:hypothetical protein